MKKKFSLLLTAILAIITAFTFTACSKGDSGANPNLDDYHYHGEPPFETMTVDEGITLDGVLSESIWANCKNTLRATSDKTPYYDEATKTYKYMDVRTYFGKNGIYVSFEVYDNAIYYNNARIQTRNTGVELYFGAIENLTHGETSMSIRITPTGKDLEPVLSFWRGDTKTGDYKESKAPGDYLAAAKINGTLNEKRGAKEDDIGYVAELAISYDLFGGPVEAYHFTASFIQMADFGTTDRYGNSFILGTGHVALPTWKAVTNEGVIADKTAYLDRSVAVDEGVTIDGKLDDAFWADAINNNKGKDWQDRNTLIGLNMYTVLTDLGVYLGLDCNDKFVYFNNDRKAKYNTGAEIFVVPNGETSITPNAKQMRFNVGDGVNGKTERYTGVNASWAWESAYFKARVAGAVKGEGATYNSSNTEGWTAEIFIPWSELGATTEEQKSQIAIQTNVYHSPTADYWDNDSQAAEGGRNYIYPNNLFNAQTNPQETFFIFDKEGFRFNAITAKNASIDTGAKMLGSDILANNPDLTAIDASKNYYYVDTITKVSDGGIRRNFSTSKVPSPDGSLSSENDELIYEYLGNGDFRLYFAEDTALTKDERRYEYTNVNGTKVPFKVLYDANMAVNGEISGVDAIVLPILADNENKAALINNSYAGANIVNGFSAVPNEKAIYAVSLIMDDAKKPVTEAIYYFGFGDTVTAGMLKVTVDLVKNEYSVLLNDGSNWKSAPEYKDLVTVAVGTSLPDGIGGTGYVVEMKLEWSAINADEMRDFIKVSPVISFGGESYILGQNYKVNDTTILDDSNFLRFGVEGFAPNAIYAQESILFVHDDGITAGSSYSKDVAFSYLGHGGLSKDVTAPVALEKEQVEATNLERRIPVTVLGLDTEVVMEYVKPAPKAFSQVGLVGYLNFDYGAENLVASAYSNNLTMNTDGVAFVGDSNYAGDKYFDANMNKRSVKVPLSLDASNFTVSLLVNGDELRSYPDNSTFILFGTGNLNNGREGFTVRGNGSGITLRTTAAIYEVPFDMSMLDGWKRLTFAFQIKGGNAIVTAYIGHKLVGTVNNVTMAGGYNVAKYGTLGIGGPGSVADEGVIYANVGVGIDDIIIFNRHDLIDPNRRKQNIYDMIAFTEQLNNDANFGSEVKEFNHNFNEFAVAGATVSGAMSANSLNGDITFGGAWKTATGVTINEETNTVTYTIDRATAVALSKSHSWFEANGVKKYVGFNFAELCEVEIDVDAVSVWKKSNIAGKYNFEVEVTSQGASIVDGLNLIFKQGETTLDATHLGNGVWSVAVPANLIEALETGDTVAVTASIDGNEEIPSDSFLIAYNKLTVDQIADLAQNVEIVVDFENNSMVNTITGDSAVKVWGNDAEYDGGAYVSNLTERVYGINAEVGTGSFTISALINVDDMRTNSWQGGSGRRTTLFGTCDVDGAKGFGVAIENANGSGHVRLKINGVSEYVYGALNLRGSGYERFTFIFDRSKEGKLGVRAYQGSKICINKEYALDSTVSLDNNGKILGIGSGGVYEAAGVSGDIRFEDFVFYRGSVNEAEIADFADGVDSYFEDISWMIEDVVLDYQTVTEGQQTEVNLTLLQGGSKYAFSDITYTGLPEGVTINAQGKLVIPADKINEFVGFKTITATLGEARKTFTVVYYPLSAIFVDLDEKEVWGDEKTGGNYEVTVKAFIDAGMQNAVNTTILPISFKLGETALTANATATAGEYVVVIPATLIDNQDAVTITATAGKTGVADATFKVSHKRLDETTITKLVNNTASYLNFENNSMVDIVNAVNATKIYDGSVAPTFDGGAYVSNVKDRAYGVKASIGTNSFSVSALINVADLKANTINGGGRKTTLFGTGDVNSASGFSVGVDVNGHVRVQYNGVTEWGWGVLDYNSTTGYERFTVIVDRESEVDKFVISVYQGATLKFQRTWALASTVSLDFQGNSNKNFGIGGGGVWEAAGDGNRGTGDIRYEDFMLYNGILTEEELRGVDPANSNYATKVAEKYGVGVADVNLDFSQVQGATSYTANLELLNYGKSNVTGATLKAEEGFTLSEEGGVYKLAIDATGLEKAKSGQVLTLNFGDLERTFTVTYAPLEALYTDATAFSMWGDEKTGDNYVVNIGVFINEQKSLALTDDMGVTLALSGVDNATIAYNGANWTVTLPKASVENQATKTITVSVADNNAVTGTSFTFTHKFLDETALTKLVNGTESYLSFENSLQDIASENRVGTMAIGTATYADGVDGKAITLNTRTSTVLLDGVDLGTTSFTMSFDVNVDGSTVSGNNNEFVSSLWAEDPDGWGYDRSPATFQMTYRADNRVRIAVGRNGGVSDHYAYNQFVANSWQRYTLVVERNVAFNEGAEYPESATISLYRNATLVYSKTATYAEAQKIGFDKLYLGGHYSLLKNNWMTDNNFLMDNFVLYRGAMTADEVRGMTSANSPYYAQIAQKYGFKVADVNFDSSEITSADGHTVDLEFVNYGGIVPTGATLKAEEGFTLSEEGGVYKLAIDATGLTKAQSGQTLTIDFAGVERSFTVTYTPVGNLFVQDVVKLYDFEKNTDDVNFENGYVIRDVKVTSDEAGTTGVNNVTFGDGIEVVKASTDGSGVYTLKIPYATANYEVSHLAVATPVEMSITLDTTNTMLVKDTSAPALHSTHTTEKTNADVVQGGRAYNVGANAFGTDSFSLSVMVRDLNTTKTGGNGAFFTNSNVDAYNGFVFYTDTWRWRFRAGDGSTVASSSDINYSISSRLAGWHHLIVTFDRSATDTITYTVYIDGQSVGSATFALSSSKSFDVEDGTVVVGSVNRNYAGTEGSSTYISNGNSTTYGLAGTVITKGIIDVNVATEYVRHNVQPAIDAFEAQA